MGLFDVSFESFNGTGNYFDTFEKDNNKTKTFYDVFRPLSESTYSLQLADDRLKKAVKIFQNVATEAGFNLAIGQVSLKELPERKKTLSGYPDEVYVVPYKPLGQHRNPKDSDGSFIDIDWEHVKSSEGKDAVSLFVIVLTHEYVHERMKTDSNFFGQEDAYYVQKEEALANALTLDALDRFGDQSLFDFAEQFMNKQPQELGYRYGIEIYRKQKEEISALAEEWKKEKEGIVKPTREEKTAFYQAVMKGLKNSCC